MPRATPTMVVLLRGGAEMASWPLVGWASPDLSTVGHLARLQLAARRVGCSISLRDADADLLGLLDLAGLGEIVGLTPPDGERTG